MAFSQFSATQKTDKTRQAESLLDAALDGDLATCRQQLDKGVDIDVRDSAGHTPLSEACCAGHLEVAAFLLSRGAKVNTVSHELKRSGLHRAAFHGYAQIAELLIDHGADPTLRDGYGELAEHLTTSDKVRTALSRTPKTPAAYRPAETGQELGASELLAEAASAEETKLAQAAKAKAMRAALEQAQANAAATAKAQALAAEAAETEAAAAQASFEQDAAEWEQPAPKAQRLQRKLFVEGAGEARLNGSYSCLQDQIDETWAKDGDLQCKLTYKQHKQEWTLTIDNYKKWNTLYRVMERREEPKNIVMEEKENGDCVLMKRPPAEPPANAAWLKWFGTSPVPTVTAATVDQNQWEEAAAAQAAADAEAASAEVATEHLDGGTKLAISEEPQPAQREFLEVNNPLEIVARDTGSGQETASAAVVGGPAIVETADGLFAPEELDEERSWAPVSLPVAPDWAAVVDGKDRAAALFRAGDFAQCASLFTGCIDALPLLQETEELSKAELKDMRTALHANRALACIKLEQWHFAVQDCDEALRLDARQFKVCYRRALARRELGQLDLALEDASKVCEHYMTQAAPNPEAWELRDSIIAKLKEERKKWHDGPRARAWNKTIAQAPPKDLSMPAVFEPASRAKPVGRGLGAPAAPRSAVEIEKHLQYWRKHGGGDDYVKALPAALVSKVAWNPDILGTMVSLLLRLAESDAARSLALLRAMKAPDALTWAMLDEAELDRRDKLLDALAPLGADLSPWR